MTPHQYYPPTLGNLEKQSSCLTVSQNTANVLRNLQTLYNTSEYTQQYRGNDKNRLSITKSRERDEEVRREDSDPMKYCYGNQITCAEDKKTIIDLENDRPYTSIYKSDYLTGSSSNNYKRPSSIKNLKRNNLLRNSSTGNKSVKFRDQVAILDGYQTSLGFVNDLNPVSSTQDMHQLRAVSRPATAPTLADSLSHGRVHGVPFSPHTINPNHSTLPLRPSTTGSRMGTQLLQMQNNFSKTAAHRKFHWEFPENAPDIRRTPDTRITTNERRHVIPEVGCHSYYFHG